MMAKQNTLDPKSFYDKMAPFYDRRIEQTRYLSATEEGKFLESLLGGYSIILDLGCGTGRTMKLLHNSDRRIVGVDLSSEMIGIAKAAYLNVIQASCYELPFGDEYFDVVYSIHMGFGICCNRSEMEMLSRELFRVLKEQGVIILDTPHGKVHGKEFQISWTAGDEVINAIFYGKTKEEITEVLTDSGFVDISFYGFYSTSSELDDDSRRIIVVARKL